MKKIQPLHWLIILHVAFIVLILGALIQQKGHPKTGREKILVLPLEGVIAINERSVSGPHNVDSLVRQLKRYQDDKDIKAIVLRINSPGGSIAAVQEIYAELKKLKEKGVVIVSSFGDVAASGGYYVASLSDKIVANPGSLTGSIGVIMQISQVKGLLEKVGISFETIKSGQFKDSGSPFRKMTDTEREYFSDIVLDAYDQFFSVVKLGRNLNEPELIPLADGRVFTGRMALHHKLVDELGGLQDAIELAKKLTNLTDKNPDVIYQKEKNTLDRLIQMKGNSPLDQLGQISDNTQIM